jgi:hypothetical protein
MGEGIFHPSSDEEFVKPASRRILISSRSNRGLMGLPNKLLTTKPDFCQILKPVNQESNVSEIEREHTKHILKQLNGSQNYNVFKKKLNQNSVSNSTNNNIISSIIDDPIKIEKISTEITTSETRQLVVTDSPKKIMSENHFVKPVIQSVNSEKKSVEFEEIRENIKLDLEINKIEKISVSQKIIKSNNEVIQNMINEINTKLVNSTHSLHINKTDFVNNQPAKIKSVESFDSLQSLSGWVERHN